MRILGLDFGSKTVGVAVSDPLGITAQPVEIVRRKSENKLRQTLARIPPDPRPHGQHRLPHSGRQQIRQQHRQPRAETQVSGPVRMGTHHAPLHPAGFRVPQRQDFPRTKALVLQSGTGRNPEISFFTTNYSKKEIPEVYSGTSFFSFMILLE